MLLQEDIAGGLFGYGVSVEVRANERAQVEEDEADSELGRCVGFDGLW